MQIIDAPPHRPIPYLHTMPTPTPQPRRDAAALQPVQRWDRVQLEADLEPAGRSAEGYLRAHAAVAVPGVMEYVDAAGNVTRELIPEEELHNADSLITLGGLPVTLGHPDEDVSPDNVGSLGVGTIGPDVEVLKSSGHVRVLAILHRRDALDAVAQGTVEVSPGYTTVIDPTPGVHPRFGRYDAVQTRRRYNHLAIVDEARGGPTVKLRADGARVAARRADAAPHTAPLTPGPSTGGSVHPFLITLAALCALPYATRADGKVRRTDMPEDQPAVTEDQLVAAIADAIRQLQAKAAASDAEPAEGDMTPEAMKARIAELEGQLAAMQAAKASADAEAAAQQEKADRAHLDSLADRLGVDRSAWTDATTSGDRKLAIAMHKGLIPAGTKADAVDRPRLDGMVHALAQLHPDPAARGDAAADPWAGITVDPKPRSDWSGPTGTGKRDGTPADPMKAAIRERNDRALQRGGAGAHTP